MNGYEKDQRRTPYSNSKAFNPMVIWGIATWLFVETVAGTAYVIRLEGAVERNHLRHGAEIMHVKELQRQKNDHTEEALKDLDEKLDEIERLLRENLKENRNVE